MNIYVSRVSVFTTAADIKELFSEFGSVKSAELMFDRFTGRSLGYGFVEMESDAEGTLAIEGINNKEIKGRVIKVMERKKGYADFSRGQKGRTSTEN